MTADLCGVNLHLLEGWERSDSGFSGSELFPVTIYGLCFPLMPYISYNRQVFKINILIGSL
jgi:hypothetical protein